MNKILLRIADLRKKAKVTQQEPADYFKVSTDRLLGLKPLDDGETYIPEKTATKDFWNQKPEYLLRNCGFLCREPDCRIHFCERKHGRRLALYKEVI